MAEKQNDNPKKCKNKLTCFVIAFVLWICFMIFLSACMPKYEVIQPVQEKVYHLQGVKKKDVLIILSEKKLEVGSIIRPKKEQLYINYNDVK